MIWNIHIATLGKMPDNPENNKGKHPKVPVISGIQKYADTAKLYLLGSDRSVFEEIKSDYGPFKKPEIMYEKVEGFDFNEIITKIISIYRNEVSEHKTASFFVNITGGTKVMTAGALVAAHYIGAIPYYIKRDDAIIELPIPKVPPLKLTEVQIEILKLLKKSEDQTGRNDRSMSQSNIANKIRRTRTGNVSHQKAGYNCRKLEEWGYINRRQKSTDERSYSIKLTEIGKMSFYFL